MSIHVVNCRLQAESIAALPSHLFRLWRLCASSLSSRHASLADFDRLQLLACSCLVPIRFLCPRGPSDGSCQPGKYACDPMVQGRFSSMMARGLTWSASTRKHHRWLAMPVNIMTYPQMRVLVSKRLWCIWELFTLKAWPCDEPQLAIQ